MRESKTLLFTSVFSLLLICILTSSIMFAADSKGDSNGAPIITLDSPLNNSIIINGTIIDLDVTADSGLDEVWYSINGGGNSSLLPPFDFNTSCWGAGAAYLIDVWANDTIGNTSHELYQFEIILDYHEGDLVIGTGEIYHILKSFKVRGNITVQQDGLLISENTSITINNTDLGPVLIRINGSMVLNDTNLKQVETLYGSGIIELTDNATANLIDSVSDQMTFYCGLSDGLNDTSELKTVSSEVFQVYGYDYAEVEIFESVIAGGIVRFYDNCSVLIGNITTSFTCYFYENSEGTIDDSNMGNVYVYNLGKITITNSTMGWLELNSDSEAILGDISSGLLYMSGNSEVLVEDSNLEITGSSAENIIIENSSVSLEYLSVPGRFNIESLSCYDSFVNLTDVSYSTLISSNSMFGVTIREPSPFFSVNATLEADSQVDGQWPGVPVWEHIEVMILNTTCPSQESFSALGKYIFVSWDKFVNWTEIRIYYTVEEITSLGIPEGRLRMFYYNGTEWVICNDTGVDGTDHYVWANLYNESESGYYYSISCILDETKLSDPSTFIEYSDSCTIETYLMDLDDNPLSGQTVHFEYFTGSWTYLGNDVTDSMGYASYTFDCTWIPNSYEIRARFDGQPFYYMGSVKNGTLDVYKENSSFSYFDPSVAIYSDSYILSVDIRDHDDYSNYLNLAGTVSFDLYESDGTTFKKSLGSGAISSGTASLLPWDIDVIPANYKVRVYYAGNAYYNQSEYYFDLTIIKEDTLFYNYTPSTMTYENTVTISIELRDADTYSNYENLDGATVYFKLYDSTGTSLIKDLGSDTLAGGAASIMWTVDEPAGAYIIKVSWDGNAYYNLLEQGFSITIYGKPTELSDPSTSGTYSDSVTITTRLTDNESNPLGGRLVYFEYDDGGWIVLGSDTTNSSGYASIDVVITLLPSSWDIRVRFDGNSYYSSSTQTGTLSVAKETTVLSDPSTSIEYSDTGAISTTLEDDEGNPLSGLLVSFELYVSGSWQGIGTDTTDPSGIASIQYAALILPNSYSLRVRFNGDSYYLSDTLSGVLTISTEQTQLSDPSTAGLYADSVTIEVYLTDNDPNPVEGRTVIFDYYNGTHWNILGSNTTDSNGYTSITVVLLIPEGNYTLRASFGGDSYYAASSRSGYLLVGKRLTQISDPSTEAEFTDYALIEVQLEDSDENPLDSKEIVFYYWNGSDWEILGADFTNSSGWVSYGFVCTWLPGNYQIRVWFAGDSNYTSSFHNGSLAVFKESSALSDPSLSGVYSDSVTISTILMDADSLSGVAGRTVIFEYDDPIFGWQLLGIGSVSTDADGEAEINFTIDSFMPGQWRIRVRFEGDSYFNTSSVTGFLTVVKETTVTTIVSMPDAVTGGSTFTVIISVADDDGQSVENIRVRLYVDGVLRKEEYTDDNGRAQFSLNLPEGSYTIRFASEGDEYYQGSEFSDTLEVGSGLGIFGEPLFYVAIAVPAAAIGIIAYLYKMKIFPFKRTYQLIQVQNPYIKQTLKLTGEHRRV